MTQLWKTLERSICSSGFAVLMAGLIAGWMSIAVNVNAQIVPDDSLGEERSQVTSLGQFRLITDRIDGGAVRGTTLFHSFREFNVGENQRVYFANPVGVTNILSRVTGTNPSRILGRLGVSGSANLFLLNPNGLIFGPNASLDVSGSFVASAASRFRFADGSEFSAVNPQAPPLLRISVPVGLQFMGRSGDISNAAALQSNQSLTLQGRTLRNTARLTTNQGSIQLLADNALILDGSSSAISTNGGGVLLQSRGDIRMQNQSSIGVTVPAPLENGNTGRIRLRAGRNIILNGAALLNTVQEGVRGEAGAVRLRAGDRIVAIDSLISSSTQGEENNQIQIDLQARSIALTRSSMFTTSLSTSDTSGLRLRAGEQIVIAEGSIVSTGANGLNATGRGGTLDIQTGDRQVEINPDERSDRVIIRGSRISTATTTAGPAGALRIRTGELRVENAIVTTATLADGDAGNVEINAARIVVSAQEGASPPITSSERIGINASVGENSTGQGGAIIIRTDQLAVQDDGEIASSTFSQFAEGDSGTLQIRTRELTVQRGGQINSSTSDKGDAGQLAIVASDAIRVSGGSPDRQSGLLARSTGAGDAGSLSITTDRLGVDRGATISVDGLNDAGNLVVNANRILIDNGRLEAVTQSGTGANIIVNSRDYLLLRNQGLISAEAENNGSGGNVRINAADGFVIAATRDNGTNSGDNDIIANANQGNGGQITITTQGLFGLAVREQSPFTNDINASSRFGLDGEIRINQPDVDPSRGLAELPTDLTDPANQIAQVCPTGEQIDRLGEFIVTGRGGLPASPADLLSSDNTLTPWVTAPSIPVNATRDRTGLERLRLSAPFQSPPVEAEGWVIDAQGKVILVATTSAAIATKSCP